MRCPRCGKVLTEKRGIPPLARTGLPADASVLDFYTCSDCFNVRDVPACFVEVGNKIYGYHSHGWAEYSGNRINLDVMY